MSKLCIFTLLFSCLFTSEEPQPSPPKIQYTIIVFCADWCNPCHQIKATFKTDNIKKIVKEQYGNDLYFIDVEDKKNAKILDGFKASNLSLPTTFLVCRTSSEDGVVLSSGVGSMRNKTLAEFLDNPSKYQKKIPPLYSAP